MQIVAHPDDDLLFQSPDVLHDVRSGRCVRTVYVTAGERGGNINRLLTREAGVEAAYAQMAGVANSWTMTDAGVAGHPMPLLTLARRPNISLVFMRLPQGFWGEVGRPKDEAIQNERGGINTFLTIDPGVGAASGHMAGAASASTTDAFAAGDAMVLDALTGHPMASQASMRLPAGFWRSGITLHDETIQNLWLGNVSQVHAEDGSSAYTKPRLISTLTALMTMMQPDTIRTQNYLGTFGDGDHDDHHAAAYFARSAHLLYATSHTFIGYLDYATKNNWQNVFGPDLTAKTNAFTAYLAFDSAPCGSPPDCGSNNYAHWLKRQYIVGTDPSAPATPPASNGKVAPIRTLANPAGGQTVSGTIDVTATQQDPARPRRALRWGRVGSHGSPSRAVRTRSFPPARIPEGPS